MVTRQHLRLRYGERRSHTNTLQVPMNDSMSVQIVQAADDAQQLELTKISLRASALSASTHQLQAINVPFILVEILQQVSVLHPPRHHTTQE